MSSGKYKRMSRKHYNDILHHKMGWRNISNHYGIERYIAVRIVNMIREMRGSLKDVEVELNNPGKKRSTSPGQKGEDNNQVVTTHRGGKTNLYTEGSRIKSLDDLIAECDIDLDTYKIDKWICRYREQPVRDEKDKIQMKKVYYISADLSVREEAKQRAALEDQKALVTEQLKELSLKPSKPTKSKSPSKNHYMVEICIPDIHVGKLGVEEEVGEEYNMKIAEERFSKSVDHFINNLPDNIEKIVFPIGNDLLHVDTLNSTTQHGTFQDSSSTWYRIYKKCQDMMIQSIIKLHDIAPVHVIIVPGNHDYTSMLTLGNVLEIAFSNDDWNIQVDNSPNPRKYVEYYANLIGFTHGSEEKIDDLPMIMMTENDNASKKRFREFHLGHVHKESVTSYYKAVDDYRGIIVRRIPSVSGKDSWHHKKGYKAQKSSQCFIYHKTKGLSNVLYYNI